MIYTGDLGRLLRIKDSKLNREDYIIVLGDMGICWDNDHAGLNNALKDLGKKKFTILFLDGNHENFNVLNSFKVEDWNGGKVHKLSENVIHLMRGSIFNLQGKTFATIGGGDSIDKVYRQDQVSWWFAALSQKRSGRKEPSLTGILLL